MTDFQASSSYQGAMYERHVADRLRLNGYEIIAEHRLYSEVGVNVDIVAATTTGIIFAGECKATLLEGKNRPGLQRTDSVKKAIADAWAIAQLPTPLPYVIFTNAEPENGSALTMLTLAQERGLVAAVVNVDRYGDINKLASTLEPVQ